jgi:3-hydroxyisobutyrate dehydrogenase-like beta-hydroxyacid dehydrogenase
MSKRIAFIGLGRMGAGIAANVLKSGMEMTVWNRTPGKCEPLRAMGAAVAETPRQATIGADVALMACVSAPKWDPLQNLI